VTGPAPSGGTRPPAPPLPPRAWLRWDRVEGILDELRPRTVLEIGCGQGAFGARLAARAEYLGLEPDPSAYDVARARIEPLGGRVVNGTHEAAPPGAGYDLVCFFEVLEHVRDDAAMLKAWSALARPGGHVLLSVPAFADRFGPMDAHAGHYRRYDPADLRAVLLAAGLEEPRLVVYGWPLGYALEVVRNRVAARTLAHMGRTPTPEEMTAASGRFLQPSRPAAAAAIAAATLPFRYLQRVSTTRGTGLVAVARRP
jgi:SAM-dependent methyltransferase